MLSRVEIPGLLVTGTDTGIGKTVVAGAIAAWFRARTHRAGVFKPIASGCVKRREGLVSEDAEFLAHCADAAQPLDIIAPQRFAEPLAPTVAAQRAGVTIDWAAIQRSLSAITRASDVIVVEGIGGILVPMDERHTMLDVAKWLALPAIVVARPALGTINHTLLTLRTLREADVPIAGVVINRYPAENASIAEETNPRVIEKWGKVPILAIVPETRQPIGLHLPQDISAALAPVDWSRFAGLNRQR